MSEVCPICGSGLCAGVEDDGASCPEYSENGPDDLTSMYEEYWGSSEWEGGDSETEDIGDLSTEP